MNVGVHHPQHGTAPIAESIRNILARFPEVGVGYLFGSMATGKQGPLSDVDIAILLTGTDPTGAIEGKIHETLSRELRTDRIDLIGLRKAPAALAYRVLKDGQCIYCRDEKLRLEFMTHAVMRYLDFKPVRDQAFRIARDKTLEAA